jgi:hypothetical protein
MAQAGRAVQGDDVQEGGGPTPAAGLVLAGEGLEMADNAQQQDEEEPLERARVAGLRRKGGAQAGEQVGQGGCGRERHSVSLHQ